MFLRGSNGWNKEIISAQRIWHRSLSAQTQLKVYRQLTLSFILNVRCKVPLATT